MPAEEYEARPLNLRTCSSDGDPEVVAITPTARRDRGDLRIVRTTHQGVTPPSCGAVHERPLPAPPGRAGGGFAWLLAEATASVDPGDHGWYESRDALFS